MPRPAGRASGSVGLDSAGPVRPERPGRRRQRVWPPGRSSPAFNATDRCRPRWKPSFVYLFPSAVPSLHLPSCKAVQSKERLMPEIVFHALEDRSVEQKRAPGSHRRCGEKLSWMHGDHQVVELARRIGQGGGVLFSEMADKPCPPAGGGASRLCPACRSLQVRLQAALRLRKHPSSRRTEIWNSLSTCRRGAPSAPLYCASFLRASGSPTGSSKSDTAACPRRRRSSSSRA
jgi:hypothetical protein